MDITKDLLTYDFFNKNWKLKGTSIKPKKPRMNLYWGASRVPLPVNIINNLTESKVGRHFTTSVKIKELKQKLVLGPMIGILSSQTKNGALMGLKNNFKDIMKAGQRYGAIIYVFTPQDIDWKTEKIKARIYHFRLKKWIRCTFPFPNVIYNRIPTRKHEKKKIYQECMMKLLEYPNINIFNPSFFNKEQMFKDLANYNEISKYLPQTQQIKSKSDFFDMLNAYSAVYLKPASGKKGAGIIKAEVDREGKTYKFHYYQLNKVKMVKTPNKETFWKAINKRMKSTYIIQEAIKLAEIDGCPFDCRVLVQKNKRGAWSLSGIGIRVAGNSKSITTHVPRGGKSMSPQHVLPKIFSKDKAADIISNIKQLTIQIAKKLENHYPHLAEASMDIGVDKNGHLWFFEANAKPMKFDEPTIRKKQIKNIIDYAQYITF